jgi:hypothetical protein
VWIPCYDDIGLIMIHPTQVGLAEAQQIKAARKPNNSSAHPTQREAQSTQKTSPMGERVSLPFKVASSSQIKQDVIILRHLSLHLWTSGSNCTPQEGCGPRDRTVHHTVQGCPHQIRWPKSILQDSPKV